MGDATNADTATDSGDKDGEGCGCASTDGGAAMGAAGLGVLALLARRRKGRG